MGTPRHDRTFSKLRQAQAGALRVCLETFGSVTFVPLSMMQRRAYPYDLTDEQYHLIADLLPTEKPAGAPGRTRSHSNRELLNAILYHLQVGGSWRSLPHDLPHWNSVYTYFRRWSVDGTLERCQEVLRRRLREKSGKSRSPSV